jgi:hypothetical protein
MRRFHGFYLRDANAPKSVFHSAGTFGRLFPSLPPFGNDTTTLRKALKEIGKTGGIMDARDDLSDENAHH